MPEYPSADPFRRILFGVRESTTIALTQHAAEDVRQFARCTPEGWDLQDVAERAGDVGRELAQWMADHAPSSHLHVTLLWDNPILHVEVGDRGALAPDPNVSRRDAEFAVRVLTPPVLEWGCDLDSRGRRLWATLRGVQEPA